MIEYSVDRGPKRVDTSGICKHPSKCTFDVCTVNENFVHHKRGDAENETYRRNRTIGIAVAYQRSE